MHRMDLLIVALVSINLRTDSNTHSRCSHAQCGLTLFQTIPGTVWITTLPTLFLNSTKRTRPNKFKDRARCEQVTLTDRGLLETIPHDSHTVRLAARSRREGLGV